MKQAYKVQTTISLDLFMREYLRSEAKKRKTSMSAILRYILIHAEPLTDKNIIE